MFGFFRKQRAKRELETLRRTIEVKRADVAASEAECKKAWGKKWSYIQMQKRRYGSGVGEAAHAVETDGQAEVFEMRRRQCFDELKAKERELEELLARESALALEAGEKPITPPEEHGEKR